MTRWWPRWRLGALMMGVGAALLPGCNGNSLTGSVGGVELEVEDGFYAEFEWEGTPYYAVVLTDIPDACNAFRETTLDLGSNYGVFQLWLTGVDLVDYPAYAFDHLDEASSRYSISWYTSVINSKEVVNTDGVAGVAQVTDFDYDDKALSGNLDIIFSGNGNRFQGSFSVPYCEVDWADAASQLLATAL